MALFNRVIGGFRALFRRTRVEQELDEELREYLEAVAEEKVRAGMSREAALRAARVEMGSPEAVKDRVRDVGWESLVDTLRQDVRVAIRMLRRSPGFAAAAIATLGLGIGGTTAIFSVVDGLFLRAPEGVADAARLRRVYIKRDAGNLTTPVGGPGSWVDYVTMHNSGPAFVGVGAYFPPELVDLGRGATAEQVLADVVSHDFLQVLGVRLAIGRFFLPEEDGVPGARPAVIISHVMWQTRFGGATDAIGKTLLLNGVPIEIVGVTERGFDGIGAQRVEVWLPSAMAAPLRLERGDWRATALMLGINYVARLAPGIEDRTATRQAATALGHAAEAEPELDPTPDVLTAPIVLAGAPYGTLTGDLSVWLASVAALVLLIACANVANLLLARGIARRRELAVRLSLGGGPWRVARQILTESLVLALAGGAAGVLLAYWAMALMRQFPLPPSAGHIDGRLLAFALGISLLTGLIFGLLPAMRAVQVDPVQALKDSRAISPPARTRTRRALVVLQVSLSLALLVGAGLFVRSLGQVNAIDSGVDVDRLLIARVDLRGGDYTAPAREEFYELALSRLALVPGVERASIVHFEPFYGASVGMPLRVPGRAPSPQDIGNLNLAGPGYFETAGARLLAGRTIEAADRRGGERVAVVNEPMARQIAPDGRAVGVCVTLYSQLKTGACTRIVGVVEAERHRYLDAEPMATIFLPRAQAPNAIPFGIPALVVRTHGEPVQHVAAVRSALQGLRSDLPYVSVKPLTDSIRRNVLPFRLGATLFSLFGVLALVLAAVGLYGVLGYFVTERTPEIGIRRSLGAPRGTVVALVMRQGLLPVCAGLVLGLAIALGGTRYLASLLFGVDARDPASFIAAAVFLVCVALLATLLPAWRAARIDPMVALRQD